MPETNARKVRKDLNLKVVISAVAVFAVLCICIGLLACNYVDTKAHNVIDENVYVNSIHVGGLTAEEAKTKIEQSVNEEYFNKTVSISYGGKTHDVNVMDFVSVDSKQTADAAMEVRAGEKKQVIPFKLTLDDKNVKKELVRFALGVEEKSDFLSFEEDYTVAKVDVSKLNEVMDIDKTLKVIADNAGRDIFDGVEGVLVKKGEEGFADALYTRISRSAVDASVGINDDQSTYIIPEIVGIDADKTEFLNLYNSSNGIFTMPVSPVFPELTTEELDIEFYQDVLGTYTSRYDGSLVNRTKNVSLAAEYVNGTILMPGQVFSYNKVVGPRTAERGFRQATVYTGEGTEEGLGGGICQVSSTIYCAQLRANLKTVSRTNHSYTVAYVPLGQDATVSYGILDYLFENDTSYPIKIETIMGGGKLTVNILGTKVDKSLSYDIVSVTNSTIAKKEIQKEDPTIPTGETKVKQNGQNGAVVSTYKVYYKDGEEIKREYIGKSTYVAMNKIILVGTGEVAENPDDMTNPDITNPDAEDANTEEPALPDVEQPETGDDSEAVEDTEPSEETVTDNEISEPLTSDTGL